VARVGRISNRVYFPPRFNLASSLLTLLDDIATVLDDVAVMTKIAAKKTAGVLGDDLALNVQQVAGIAPHRELPVIWAVAKGSMLNKAILVPAALLLSAFVPLGGDSAYDNWWGLPLLRGGGEAGSQAAALRSGGRRPPLRDPAGVGRSQRRPNRLRAWQGAVRTDFILSAEIIVITLGTVAKEPFAAQVGVLIAIAVLMTVGVYGLVPGIVKLEDAGLFLSRHEGEAASWALNAR